VRNALDILSGIHLVDRLRRVETPGRSECLRAAHVVSNGQRRVANLEGFIVVTSGRTPDGGACRPTGEGGSPFGEIDRCAGPGVALFPVVEQALELPAVGRGDGTEIGAGRGRGAGR